MPWSGTTIASIPAGQALSGVVDLAEARLCGIAVPANWTAASLTFQVSVDGVTWLDLYDGAGPVSVPQAQLASGRLTLVDPQSFYGLRYLKLKSSNNQANAVDVQLLTVPR